MINATPTQLRRAADIQEKIMSLQSELGQLLGSEVSTPAKPTEAPMKKSKMSAAGRAAIRAAQKARWAKIRGTSPSAKPAQKPKKQPVSEAMLKGLARARAARWAKSKGKVSTTPAPKRKMSAQGLANIRAGVAKRMAKAKKAAKGTL